MRTAEADAREQRKLARIRDAEREAAGYIMLEYIEKGGRLAGRSATQRREDSKGEAA